MRLHAFSACALACLAAAGGCAQAGPAPRPASTEKAGAVPGSITRFFESYFRAVEAGDPDGILAHIDEDFVIKWPIGRPITDRARLREALARFQASFRQEIEWEILEARDHGQWAWVRSVERPTHYPKAGGEPRTLAGSRLTILRKVGGRWLMHRDYGSLDALPAGMR